MSKLVWPKSFINQIICGDCLEVMRDIPDKSVDLILTDPPYVLPIVSVKSRNSGELFRNLGDFSLSEFYFKTIFKEFKRILKHTGCLFVFCDDTFYTVLFRASYEIFRTQMLIWDKGRIGMGRNFRKEHELLLFGYSDNTPKISTELGTIFEYRVVNPNDRVHLAQKPTSLLEFFIEKATKKDDVVLDCFSGSGSTCIATRNLYRNYIGIEISPEYCKIAENRLKQKPLF